MNNTVNQNRFIPWLLVITTWSQESKNVLEKMTYRGAP
jgi:hypothetical protein